ncbi:hypothetical protein POF45_16965 [Pseudomonas sp. 681]|uniref:Uncharacterized protein n=1 Tax=Pseudomonas fungipugnans TaxID=3024217 RepID=A0ABT6QQU2_9PSED|nr:hypothetical protein [Pseudomonas sp. 681]MDI2593106.1 hypothetical protein [Pseudomonas sp. 681]
MNGDILPNVDSVVRLCGGSHLDPDTGSPGPGAFMLREGENYLSVNWLEYFQQYSHEDRLLEVRRVLASKKKIGSAARLALLNVGNAIQVVGDNPLLIFIHEPINSPDVINDPSHSGINNIQSFEQLVAERLTQAVFELSAAKIDE